MTPRVFLDANVLFSAAWRDNAGVARLWQLPEFALVTSGFAVGEAERNLDTAERLARLAKLLAGVEIAAEAPEISLDGFEALRDKDRPILQAAIGANAGYLVTGDWRDFGPWLGGEVRGVRVRTPAAFLA